MTAEPTPPRTRRDLLLDQYETSSTMLAERLQGLGDDEYFWEPAANCWSLRRQSEVRTPRSFGTGEWRLEFARPEPSPAPVTTLAWRLCHGEHHMCRSIVQLRRPERDVTEADIAAAARQFVRKVSGYRVPSKANTAFFEAAVAEVADATRRLLAALDALPPEPADQELR